MNDDRIEGTGKKVEGIVQNTFGKVVDSPSHELKGTAKKVIGEIQDNYGKAQDYAKDSMESVGNHITEQPIKSTLIALGIGFILGKLTGI